VGLSVGNTTLANLAAHQSSAPRGKWQQGAGLGSEWTRWSAGGLSSHASQNCGRPLYSLKSHIFLYLCASRCTARSQSEM